MCLLFYWHCGPNWKEVKKFITDWDSSRRFCLLSGWKMHITEAPGVVYREVHGPVASTAVHLQLLVSSLSVHVCASVSVWGILKTTHTLWLPGMTRRSHQMVVHICTFYYGKRTRVDKVNQVKGRDRRSPFIGFQCSLFTVRAHWVECFLSG